MKKLIVLLIAAFFGLAGINCYAQQTSKKVAQKEKNELAVKTPHKKIKVDLDRLPKDILVSLRDSYAKHFVIKAYKNNKQGDIYFIELRKGRNLFAIAVDNNGRILKEIRDEQNAIAQNEKN